MDWSVNRIRYQSFKAVWRAHWRRALMSFHVTLMRIAGCLALMSAKWRCFLIIWVESFIQVAFASHFIGRYPYKNTDVALKAARINGLHAEFWPLTTTTMPMSDISVGLKPFPFIVRVFWDIPRTIYIHGYSNSTTQNIYCFNRHMKARVSLYIHLTILNVRTSDGQNEWTQCLTPQILFISCEY